MKSILERALVHLLNEENEKAEELLHQFVIETAKSIHENLREGDEECVEDAELEEAVFTEADLDDDAAAELGADLGEEMPEEPEAVDVSDDTLDGDVALDGAEEAPADEFGAEPAEAGEGEENIEAEIENFEQELADLQAKFDAWMADIEGGEEAPADDAAELGDDLGGEVADLGDEVEGAADEVAADDVAAAEEGEDEFDDITESVIDELQKVAAETQEGKGANGENLLGNTTSTKLPGKGSSAKPVHINSKGHSGFARETAPSSQALKGGSTVASTKMKNIKDNGDPKAPAAAGVDGKGADIRTPAKDAAHAKSPLTKSKK